VPSRTPSLEGNATAWSASRMNVTHPQDCTPGATPGLKHYRTVADLRPGCGESSAGTRTCAKTTSSAAELVVDGVETPVEALGLSFAERL